VLFLLSFFLKTWMTDRASVKGNSVDRIPYAKNVWKFEYANTVWYSALKKKQ